MSGKRWLIGVTPAVALLCVALLAVAASAGDPPIAPPSHLPDGRTPQAVVQPRTVTYTYDATGRLTRADYGEGKTVGYIYDKSGNTIGSSYDLYLPVVLRGF